MPAAFPFCWRLGKRGGCLHSVLGTAGRGAAEPPIQDQRILTPSSACLRRGPHRCKYERDHDGGYPPVLRKGPFHQAGRPLEAERLLASLEGNWGALAPAGRGGSWVGGGAMLTGTSLMCCSARVMSTRILEVWDCSAWGEPLSSGAVLVTHKSALGFCRRC